MGKINLQRNIFFRSPKEIVISLLSFFWFCLCELAKDRLFSWGNQTIDTWVVNHPKINALVHWVIEDGFRISSIIAVVMFLYIILSTWIKNYIDNRNIDISISPQENKAKDTALLKITNNNDELHIFCKAIISKLEWSEHKLQDKRKWKKIEDIQQYGELHWLNGNIDKDGFIKIEPEIHQFVEIYEYPKDMNSLLRRELGRDKGEFKFNSQEKPFSYDAGLFRIQIILVCKLDKKSNHYKIVNWDGFIDVLDSHDLYYPYDVKICNKEHFKDSIN